MCSYFGREKDGGVIELGRVKPLLTDLNVWEVFSKLIKNSWN